MNNVGVFIGICVGIEIGVSVGIEVGVGVGIEVGVGVGIEVGVGVGILVGVGIETALKSALKEKRSVVADDCSAFENRPRSSLSLSEMPLLLRLNAGLPPVAVVRIGKERDR